jgi:hypothetical protein
MMLDRNKISTPMLTGLAWVVAIGAFRTVDERKSTASIPSMTTTIESTKAGASSTAKRSGFIARRGPG